MLASVGTWVGESGPGHGLPQLCLTRSLTGNTSFRIMSFRRLLAGNT